MLETCTVSGFNTASIYPLATSRYTLFSMLITIEGIYGIALSLYRVEIVVDFISV